MGKSDGLRDWYCPYFDKVISEGLCYEIRECGVYNNFLRSSVPEVKDWDKAVSFCKSCKHLDDY